MRLDNLLKPGLPQRRTRVSLALSVAGTQKQLLLRETRDTRPRQRPRRGSHAPPPQGLEDAALARFVDARARRGRLRLHEAFPE